MRQHLEGAHGTHLMVKGEQQHLVLGFGRRPAGCVREKAMTGIRQHGAGQTDDAQRQEGAAIDLHEWAPPHLPRFVGKAARQGQVNRSK
jgi:hypothetical protein